METPQADQFWPGEWPRRTGHELLELLVVLQSEQVTLLREIRDLLKSPPPVPSGGASGMQVKIIGTTTQGDEMSPAQVQIVADDTGAHAEVTWVDKFGMATTAPPNVDPLVFSIVESPPNATVAVDPSDPNRGDLTLTGEGPVTVAVAAPTSGGQPIPEPDDPSTNMPGAQSDTAQIVPGAAEGFTVATSA